MTRPARYRDIASWTLLGMLGTPLLVLIGVVLALVVMTVTAHASTRQCHGILGLASWYGPESGNRTANGERFNPDGLTIAMRSRDFGRRYLVTFGGRSVVVRHTDYGPARSTGRQFDLARGAAVRLGMIRKGVGLICISPVARSPPKG